MKRITYNIAIVFLAFTAFSCGDDFLDVKPEQSVLTSDFPSSLQDYNAALIGLYDQLTDSDHYGRYFLLVPDIMGNDVKQNSQANRGLEFAEYRGPSTHFIPTNMWTEIYRTVGGANTVINGSNSNIPATVQTEYEQLLGEAYLIRAMCYFDLVRAFAQPYNFTVDGSHAGVPIITTFDPAVEPSRESVANVYAQVISDANESLNYMTENSETTRLTIDAAHALLAKVYMFMEDWDNAESHATTAINGGHSMTDSASYVSSWQAGEVTDAIFQLRQRDDDNNGADALGRMYIVEGYGDYLPSKDWVDLLPVDDLRRTWLKADTVLAGDWAPYRMVKYPSQAGADNIPVFRLAEMYLIRAEARVKKAAPDEAGAQADLDVTRLRATFDTPTTATGQALIDEILIERRRELAFEGHGIFDINRLKQDMVRTECTSITCTQTYPNSYFILPIPQAEINANPNIVQNPDYGT